MINAGGRFAAGGDNMRGSAGSEYVMIHAEIKTPSPEPPKRTMKQICAESVDELP